MKKAGYILVLLSLIFISKSCIIEESNKPSLSSIALEASNCVTIQMFTLAATIDQLRIIDLWYNAKNQQEKYQIEDEYFPYNKIRLLDNDTISLAGHYKIYTGGNSFLDNTWTVVPYSTNSSDVTYKAQQLDEKNYTIKRVTNADNYNVVQTVEIVTPNEEYIVTNQTENAPLSYYKIYDRTSFYTTEPVTLRTRKETSTPWWDSCISTTSGQVEIELLYKNDTSKNDFVTTTYRKDYTSFLFRGEEGGYHDYCISLESLL